MEHITWRHHCPEARSSNKAVEGDGIQRKEFDMTEAQKHLDHWLRDAHAMEKQAEQMLSAQAKRIENYPELSARIEEHLEETRSQIARLEACMDRRGESNSSLKDAAGKFTAMMQGFGGMLASDEVVKGGMASYAFEHLEIASYNALIAAADAVGDTETRETCEEILREEEAMANWLAENLDDVTVKFLARDEMEMDEAKR